MATISPNIIKWVQGNELELAIPLQRVIFMEEGKVVEPYNPQPNDMITVQLTDRNVYWQSFSYAPIEIRDGNVIVIKLGSEIPIGTYNVTILVVEADGTPRRSKWDSIVYIYDTNKDVVSMYDDFPDYADGQLVEGFFFYFAKGDKGDTGATPVISASASVNDTTGTPSVLVTVSGTPEAPQMAFAFSNLKGEQGATDYNELTNKPDLSVYEEKSNKVTSWQSTPSDTKYPSEKLVSDALASKQDELVSGTNIKTINNQSLLGSGNIDIQGGGGDAYETINASVTLNTLTNKYEFASSQFSACNTAWNAGKIPVLKLVDESTQIIKVLAWIPMFPSGQSGVDSFYGIQEKGQTSYFFAYVGGFTHVNDSYAAVVNVQTAIDDLETIRSGAAAGAAAYQKPATGIPSTDIASGVIPDVSNFITNSVDNLVNYYLKSETYTKSEVESLISGISQFEYEVVAQLPTASADTMGKIYLVPSADPQTQNIKDEYITIATVVGGGEETRSVTYTYSWEQIGSTAIDLSGYVTTSDLNTALADYTTTTDLTTLLNGKEDVSNKVTSWQNNTDNDHYPSEKLVKDSLDAKYVKPSGGIPSSDLASSVQTSLGKADSAYQKPSGGIPSTDFASAVQTSLGKADTAYQKPNSGIPSTDLESGVIPDVSGKEDKSNKVISWSSTPTDTHYPSEKLVYDEIGNVESVLDAILGADTLPTQRKVEIESASGTTLSAEVNKYYAFGSEVGTLAITLPAPDDLTHLSSIVFALTTGSSPAVTFTATAIGGTTPPIYAQDGFAIEASTSYEVNAIFNGASWVLALIKIATTPISSSSSSSS